MAKALGSLMEAARIQSEINRLFDNLLDLDGAPEGAITWQPNVDIVETAENLVLKVELPGVARESLALKVHAGNLEIVGSKERPSGGSEQRTHVAERQFGDFRRVVPLGVPVNTRLATAVLDNGLLRITFPKVPNRRGEIVQIEVETA